ncbi:hypothetical protein DSECCO2_435790 [anaerobic digester metagenome]
MRCIIVIVLFAIGGLFPLLLQGQDKGKPEFPVTMKDQKTELIRYRILVAENDPDSLSSLRSKSMLITKRHGHNSYIIKLDGKLQLLAGVFTKLRDAEHSRFYCRKIFKKALIVKSSNESIVEFSSSQNKLPRSSLTDTISPDTIPAMFRNQSLFWIYPNYTPANTAKDANYLTEDEKKVYYYLNLVRMLPSLYADVFLPAMQDSTDTRDKELVAILTGMTPVLPLTPDSDLYESARCFAIESGMRDYVGHIRTDCKKRFHAECCVYGTTDPLGIINCLLQSPPHREICLSQDYSHIGISIQPHKSYKVNAVLDFVSIPETYGTNKHQQNIRYP